VWEFRVKCCQRYLVLRVRVCTVCHKKWGMIMNNLYDMLYTTRQAVQEAFSKESVFSPERNAMLNALQGILERCEGEDTEIIEVDYEDIFNLYKHRHVINDAAHIHEAFMGNRALASSLRQIALNIEVAQGNNWMPQDSAAKS